MATCFVRGLGFGFVWLGLVVWCFSSPFLPNLYLCALSYALLVFHRHCFIDFLQVFVALYKISKNKHQKTQIPLMLGFYYKSLVEILWQNPLLSIFVNALLIFICKIFNYACLFFIHSLHSFCTHFPSLFDLLLCYFCLFVWLILWIIRVIDFVCFARADLVIYLAHIKWLATIAKGQNLLFEVIAIVCFIISPTCDFGDIF